MLRLFEAIIDANHRALAGDARAGVRPSEYADALPVVVLTCFDPRMHPLMPEVLGIAEPDFIWVTNAGNIITSPFSSTVRSLALACAVQGGQEIAIIGHTDCLFFQPTKLLLNQHWANVRSELGSVTRRLDEFVNRFVNERQNVDLAVKLARSSPLISRRTPIHGLLADVESGRLEWVVNGYEAQYAPAVAVPPSEEGAPGESVGLGPAPTEERPGITRPDFKLGDDLPPIGGRSASG
jgi:carbonic anhydrase